MGFNLIEFLLLSICGSEKQGNLVNSQALKIPFPWLVFNEKIKVNFIFLLDTTVVSDFVLLLFGGSISKGDLDGHLKMLGGYLEFFMEPSLAELYHNLRKDLNELFKYKLMKDHHHCKLKKSKHGILISVAVKLPRPIQLLRHFLNSNTFFLVYKF
ncbi:unnamed protein product [Lactuca saligna]|uniref:RNA helicase C-terminal domain-containing protein n=1 Tax=Lactuca saligna TaxID=75948 RepID=A0AA35Z714_LACSI|nr:unnamed protein product [Lactuca saligna]